jgi:hypothetical protein
MSLIASVLRKAGVGSPSADVLAHAMLYGLTGPDPTWDMPTYPVRRVTLEEVARANPTVYYHDGDALRPRGSQSYYFAMEPGEGGREGPLVPVLHLLRDPGQTLRGQLEDLMRNLMSAVVTGPGAGFVLADQDGATLAQREAVITSVLHRVGSAAICWVVQVGFPVEPPPVVEVMAAARLGSKAPPPPTPAGALPPGIPPRMSVSVFMSAMAWLWWSAAKAVLAPGPRELPASVEAAVAAATAAAVERAAEAAAAKKAQDQFYKDRRVMLQQSRAAAGGGGTAAGVVAAVTLEEALVDHAGAGAGAGTGPARAPAAAVPVSIPATKAAPAEVPVPAAASASAVVVFDDQGLDDLF